MTSEQIPGQEEKKRNPEQDGQLAAKEPDSYLTDQNQAGTATGGKATTGQTGQSGQDELSGQEHLLDPVGGPRRITVIMGAYGSGKSEISINYAIWLHRLGYPVTLYDLDIINPYFRSADARQAAEAEGIRLVAPQFAGTNVDVPAVPAEVSGVFDDKDRWAVLDIGGEDLGARVVATLRTRLLQEQETPAIWLVVNPYRPFTRSADQIVSLAGTLAEAAGMAPTGLIHNANLLGHGDAGLLVESWPVVAEAAGRLGLPVVFAAAMTDHLPHVWQGHMPGGPPILAMTQRIFYFR